MRVHPFVIPVALIAALLGSVVIANAAGIWSTSGRDAIDTASMTPADIKGWMTLQQIMDGLGIPQSELYELGKVPAGVPPSTALKDLERLAPGFEVSNLREALAARAEAPPQPEELPAPAEAAPAPTATPIPTPVPATPQPDPTSSSGAPITGTHQGTGAGPTPLPAGQILPAAQIKGMMTLRQVSEQCAVPLDALLEALKLPAGADADTAIKTLVQQGVLSEVTLVREAAAALQKK